MKPGFTMPDEHAKQPGAFTLIEVMVAIALFSMVMLSIYTTWNSIVRGSKSGLDAAAEAQRARVAIRAIEEALQTAQMFSANAPLYAFFADTTDPELASLSLVAHLPRSFPGSGLFGEQRMRRVTFTVEPGPDGGNELVLRQEPLLTAVEDEPYPIVLSRNVRVFGFEFWDPNNNEWALEFTATNQLPRMMRVYLATARSESLDSPAKMVMRVVSLPNIAIPPEVQAPPLSPARARGAPPRGNAPVTPAPQAQ